MVKGTNSSYFPKVVLVSVITCSILLPQGLVFADSGGSFTSGTITSVSDRTKLSIAAGEIPMPDHVTPDPKKAKFSKEEAVTKLRSLFPILKDATTSNITLGNNNSFPVPENQMVWSIQWKYQLGNNGYGFNSSVDAMTGDLISTYISLQSDENVAYYPPKLTKEQALQEAKAFITKAVTSISLKDLQLEDSSVNNSENRTLFGPIQYSFSFTTLKNGIPSPSDAINVTVDAVGNIIQFNKPSDILTYPTSKATITQYQADKQFINDLDVGLYYIPINKNGRTTDWVLGYRPVEYSMYSIDALTGKRISYEGTNPSISPVTYSEVPQTKEHFKPRTSKVQLTAEEAAKLVQEVATIPKGRTFNNSSLRPYYINPTQQSWNLNWGENTNNAPQRFFPEQSSAEIDADTGEILQFQMDTFEAATSIKDVSIPIGLAKLTKESAKQRAIDLINRLYPNASSELKIVNHEDDWNFIKESNQYRYEFQRFYKGIPVSESLTITFDIYGRLQTYYANRSTGLEKLKDTPVLKVSKAEALETYRKQYTTLKLQYSRFGGFYVNNTTTKAEMRLVYNPTPIDMNTSYQILDANSGNWVTQYEITGQIGSRITPTDIKGNLAEKALTTLVEYGVLTTDPTGKLNPNTVITEGDWLSMIVKSITPYYESYNSVERKPTAGIDTEDPIYSIVNYAVERKWIKNDTTFQDKKELTREQLAVLLTSIVQYDKISNYLSKDATVNQLTDAKDINNKGAVATIIHLGLMEVENGKFNPQQKVTKAQAATVIMNLFEIQGKTDQPIGQ
ncbi:YcdB/YcdC domain-containing protein [Paenibacillus antarcticus]|uniref:SLH domain-containing protein n=1 Tax=Paenibacillus antarcticus TaxID=253703 RepID=A0A168MSB3_9BACL|nr:YcdB/YcdC domain-containing protein [Paenibacillus antarcticus]OAB44992.1 hypothetical protein PBAT_13665 [Paenibacillus antarcticus]